jgi:hypothetical protein
MSNADDFVAVQPQIEAIPDAKALPPSLPVNVFLQEAENTHHWCQDDKDKLEAANLDWTIVDNVPILCGALRETESRWFKDRFSREEAEREWREKSPTAYDLRNQLLHDFHFAFRKTEDVDNRVSQIAEGNGHADMIQDLNDLAVLGKANTTPLTQIGFDLTLLDTAATLSDEMADLLSRATSDRADNNQARVIRDKAFTLLKQTVDEIRDCGQYIFWRDPQRYKGYVSQYNKKYNSRRSSQKELEPEVE